MIDLLNNVVLYCKEATIRNYLVIRSEQVDILMNLEVIVFPRLNYMIYFGYYCCYYYIINHLLDIYLELWAFLHLPLQLYRCVCLDLCQWSPSELRSKAWLHRTFVLASPLVMLPGKIYKRTTPLRAYSLRQPDRPVFPNRTELVDGRFWIRTFASLSFKEKQCLL